MIWFLMNSFFVVFENTFCGVWKTNSKSQFSAAWCLLLTPRQSCFKAPSVCFMKNLSKNRVRVPIVNKTKAVVFGFHLPSTVSRVTNTKIYRSWWKARWETTSRWAKTSSLCRRSGLNPSSPVTGIFFHEPSSVSLRCREMIVSQIFV